MTDLNLDILFAIAEAGPALDKAEQSLRGSAREKLADQIVKLQQDVGLEIDHEMTGAPLTGPGDGPDSARLRREYEPVTAGRLGVLRESWQALPEGDAKTEIHGLLSQLPMPQAATSRSPGLRQ